MPTTTNYGWTTPADTDLVKDGASAIRTLGTAIDTTTKNLNPETTLGDIAYRSSTANTNTRLALGTAGQVLTVNSGATAPEWSTISAGGMTLISTTTLSGATTDLTSIPQTYNSLFLIVTGMTANTSDKIFLMQPNADTSGVIDMQYSVNATAGQTSSGGSVVLSGNEATLRTDANNAFAIQINNYTSSTRHKPISFSGRYVISGPTNRSIISGGAYSSNTAITSIRFTYQGTNTFAGGTVLLYGVK
jgi:hypothetical protein